MQYINIPDSNKISTLNGTQIPLTSSSEYVGVAEDVSMYSGVTVAAKTDQAGVLYIEQSIDGINWDSILTYSVSVNINEVHRLTITRKYFRIRFLNSSLSNQSYLRIQCLIGKHETLSAPLNLPVQRDADAVNVRVNDYALQVQRGLVSDIIFFNKFGRNPDTATGDAIWVVSTAYTEPVTAEICNVVSSSIQDDFGGGTGAGKITIVGVNENYNLVTEIVELNGTTNVPTINKYINIHLAYVSSKAPSGTSDGQIGIITITSTAVGTPILSRMSIGANQTQFAGYVVPAGYTAYINSPSIQGQNTTANATLDLGLFKKDFNGVYRIQMNFQLTGGNTNNIEKKFEAPLIFEEKSTLLFKCIFAQNGVWDVSASVDIWLVKN